MFAYAVFVGILLGAQVTGANDRYQSPYGSAAAADAGPRFSNDATSGRDSVQSRVSPPPSQPSDVYTVPAGNAPRDSQPPPPLNARQVPNTSSNSAIGAGSIQAPYGYGSSTPANSAARAPNYSDQDNGSKPSTMMRTLLAPPPGSRLTGQPIKLADVIRGGGSRAEQLQRVDAYWDLCSSVADYYLSLREQDELQKLRGTVSKVGPTWQQAESELGVRIGTSQRAATASQFRLASMLGRGDSLPLPVDLPHCGDYYARYSQVFAGRQSAEAQQLSELLPLRYEELKDAATAVTRANEWLNDIAAQHSDASDGTGTLRALELLALRRRAFIQIARDYNRRIARYSELASPGEIGPERLISMLIKPEGGDNTATRFSSPAPQLNRQTQKKPAIPKTFAEGWEPLKSDAESTTTRDDAVAPASAEAPSSPHVEHSLLVSPQ
jgi:hypothetical protein